MESKNARITYIILTAVFAAVFLLAVAYSVFAPAETYDFDELMELQTVTVTRIYNNKSVDVRIETREYEAVFTLHPILEMRKLLDELRRHSRTLAFPNGDVLAEIKLRIWVPLKDEALLNAKPRKAVKAWQLEFVSVPPELGGRTFEMRFDQRNGISAENHMGIKILITCFAAVALIVSTYHAMRTSPRNVDETANR